MRTEGYLERLVILPFSMGCDCQSSIAVDTTRRSKSKHSRQTGQKGEYRGKPSKVKVKKSKGRVMPMASHGFQRLITLCRSFSSLLFLPKDEEMEQIEKEMEIGFPTDVKHVTHIGLDGSTRIINPVSRWENPKASELSLALPSISLEQFELAMAAQSHRHS